MTDGGRSDASRRRFLRAAAATGTATLLAGCPAFDTGEQTTTEPETATDTETETGTATDTETATTESPQPSEFASEYATVVNVEKAGADTSGAKPINDVLDRAVGDDTLLYFPPGRYRLEQWMLRDVSHCGLVGNRATLVPPDGTYGYWLMAQAVRRFRFEGFTIDNTARSTGPKLQFLCEGGDNRVENVRVKGTQDGPLSTGGFIVRSEGSDTKLTVKNLRLPDGGLGVGLFAHPPDEPGTLVFEDCVLEGWREGLYASPHGGPLRVVGGEYANNGIDQVRVGGGNEGSRSVVRNVTVRVDDIPSYLPRHYRNMRGIWLEEGDRCLVENCTVQMLDLGDGYSSGGIVVGGGFGRAVVRNSTVRTDTTVDAIRIRQPVTEFDSKSMPSLSKLPTSWDVRCESVRITGRAADGGAVRINHRDGTTLRDLCIQQSGQNRDGLVLLGSTGNLLANSRIDVPGTAIRRTDSSIETDNVERGAACRGSGGP